MIDRERAYLRLPTPLQHLACSLEGWRIQRSRMGVSFAPVLRAAEARACWPEEQVRAFRDQRLRDFIQHCARTVPYYRGWFARCGISPRDIQSVEDLRALPILTKAEVQEHGRELTSEAVPRSAQVISHTSGTTGTGLRFATTPEAAQEQWAIWWRYRRWHGIQPGTWCGCFGGRSVVPLSQTRPPFWRSNYPGKQVLFSAYHMSPVNLRAYVDELRARRLPWLHGYPSLLALLAAYLLDQGIDLDYPVRWLTVGAENLLPQQAHLIERAFGIRPRQHYGMAEAAANFSECERGSLHVDEDFAAVEFVPNPDGPGYRVIGTNFTNPATPLLRYEVQDLAALSEATCPCGRPGRVLTDVDGRLEDYIVLRNGALLGRMDHILKDMTRIREAQLYQNRPGEIIVRIVRGSCYSAGDEAALLREFRKRVGHDNQVLIEYVPRLERSGAGKLRFVVSEISPGQLEHACR